MDEKTWSDADIEEFKKLVAPLVEYLQTKCDLHTSIIVEWDRAVLIENVFGISCEVPD